MVHARVRTMYGTVYGTGTLARVTGTGPADIVPGPADPQIESAHQARSRIETGTPSPLGGKTTNLVVNLLI